jgi:hypothetical protein
MRSADASERSADAAERSNLLASEGLKFQRAAAHADEEERARRLRTRLEVDGWSGNGELIVTNQGPALPTTFWRSLLRPGVTLG